MVSKRKNLSDKTPMKTDPDDNETNSIITKKERKLDGDEPENEVQSSKATAPPYGSKEYWEKRYKSHLPKKQKIVDDCLESKEERSPKQQSELETKGDEEKSIQDDDDQEPNDQNTPPGHAWYFNYDEIRPLILPLILGREQDDEDDEDDEDDNGVKHDDEVSEEETRSSTQNGDENKQRPKIDTACETTASYGKEENCNVAIPKRVLEIGCGDVPLGTDLCNDMLKMQKDTGSKAKLVVSQIVCCDYSSTVIDILKERHQQTRIEREKNTGIPIEHDDLDVEYEVADARDLKYKNNFFDLVIDKGTLDAMLSDKKMGVSNCVSIVKEVARVLSIGGYFMLVSHLNANTTSGVEWVDEVVVAGLKEEGSNANWIVECHSADVSSSIGEDEEYEEENEEENEQVCKFVDDEDTKDEIVEGEEDNGSGEEGENWEENNDENPGPAVYIIQKLPPNGNKKLSTIPLKFFSY